MSEFENVVVSPSAVPSLSAAVALMILIPIVFFVYWRLKHKDRTNLAYLFAGAAGFLVFSRVLEQSIHFFCILTDNPVSRFINGSTAAFVVYGALMAGLFEEFGRYFVLNYFMRKNRTRENAVLCGIGHGACEVLLVMIPAMVTYLAAAVVFSSGDIENALKTMEITEETAPVALPTVMAAAGFDYGMAALNVLERLLAMLLHVGLTVIVAYGVRSEKIVFLPAAILLHALTDSFAALYQRGAMPLWAVELWTAVWAAAAVFIAVKLYRKMAPAEENTGSPAVEASEPRAEEDAE